jgi:hypothetical protein
MVFLSVIATGVFISLFLFLRSKTKKDKKLTEAKENLEKVETKVDIHNINKQASKLKSKLKK